MGTARHSINFVRSLRSTGCRANVVVITDNTCINMTTEFMKSVFIKCGVNFINIGNVKSKYMKDLNTVRIVIFLSFLSKYHRFIDRVLISDMCDLYFYYDPFTENITSESLIMSTECVTIHDSNVNMQWFMDISRRHHDNFMLFWDNLVVNNGFLIGGIQPIITFYSELVEIDMFRDFQLYANDQGIVNYMYYFKKFKKTNITVIPFGNGEYQSMTNCGKYFHIHPISYEVTLNGMKLSVIHQFDRYCNLLHTIKNLCPALGPDHLEPFPFLRHSTEVCDPQFTEKKDDY
ncbi:hypothetical protein TRFO_30538 [Tritrichomonas foetus]|uniref:Nucleotide-diphospho-sugar transferase domain-containing protein n=1 Tax=Tritrichomonas foetus TaxID=1144522 RepID=A0A1J4JTK7_9EUKA|nr:hypothetical protein TRFO_30538 [Tritrichomonas foetus]|eukprot:OHT02403.1 hypothetical protein TRFO_30538 [Tritrichomonas foetus]